MRLVCNNYYGNDTSKGNLANLDMAVVDGCGWHAQCTYADHATEVLKSNHTSVQAVQAIDAVVGVAGDAPGKTTVPKIGR
jgi:hypothetical protein